MRATLTQLRAIPNVRSVAFESKAQALAQEKRSGNGAAFTLLSGNPLPDTFHVHPANPADALQVRAAIDGSGAGGTGQMIDPAIGKVSNHTEDTQKLLTVTRFVTITAALLAALLTLASVVLIANTIRLSLYARRREIEVMKLVGATNWFIRWPFVIEGIIVGRRRRCAGDHRARRDQAGAARSARHQLDADRRPAHDYVRAAGPRPGRGRHRSVGVRLGTLPEALPACVTAAGGWVRPTNLPDCDPEAAEVDVAQLADRIRPRDAASGRRLVRRPPELAADSRYAELSSPGPRISNWFRRPST